MSAVATYVLEAESEFERLERQSRLPAYDYRRELSLAALPDARAGVRVLDAGCGSGIVSRHLAAEHPDWSVVGCDRSEDRVGKARVVAQGLANLRFDVANLEALVYPTGSFDLVLCRFVLQHLLPPAQRAVLLELHRVLAPEGRLVAVDFDGPFYNVHPLPSSWLQEALRRMQERFSVDFFVGRKMPELLLQAGFAEVDWHIEAVRFRGEMLAQERFLTEERFERAHAAFAEALGGDAEALRFREEYLAALDAPGAVLFYNRFVVTGFKGPAARTEGA